MLIALFKTGYVVTSTKWRRPETSNRWLMILFIYFYYFDGEQIQG